LEKNISILAKVIQVSDVAHGPFVKIQRNEIISDHRKKNLSKRALLPL
jgi:hypothetical protein